MARLHIVLTQTADKACVLYCGPEGAQADKAYDAAKDVDTVEHYRFPTPSRRRDGNKASRPTIVRIGPKPVEPKPVEPKPAKASRA